MVEGDRRKKRVHSALVQRKSALKVGVEGEEAIAIEEGLWLGFQTVTL